MQLIKGEHTVITVVGGSITAGSGGSNWTLYFREWLTDTFPNAKVSFNNGAVLATKSDYMSVCHSSHIPRESDLVVLEYSQNDTPKVGLLWNYTSIRIDLSCDLGLTPASMNVAPKTADGLLALS